MTRSIGPFLGCIVFLALGSCLAIMGIVQFDSIMRMETAGSVAGLNTKVAFLYEHLGKWGVFAVHEVLGMSFLIAAIDKFRIVLRLA